MKTLFDIQLRPTNDVSLANGTSLGLIYNVSVRPNLIKYIQSRHCTEPGLACFEISSKWVLDLSNDCATSVTNRGSLLKARAIPDYFSIHPEFIISVVAAPCETEVVKWPITRNAFQRIPFEKKKKERN